LKALHEVVVRNRLEQLRKRQRDEALQAQEELLAGVARSASKKWGATEVIPEVAPEQEIIPAEEMEEYDRAMSPALLNITKLTSDEREIDILTEEEDLRALVNICSCYNLIVLTIVFPACSTSNCCCFSIRSKGGATNN
jgi:hypothetical protein